MFQGNPVVRLLPVPVTKRVRELTKKLGLATLTALVLSVSSGIQAKGVAEAQAQVALSSLPKEAQQTQRLIHAGGPFPYPHKDGTVFGNRERMLPRSERGFYREYTVPTPGARDRGARRIVCGGRQPTQPEACFYTDDHYASFKRIAQ
jgi:ribonuclease T1